MWYRPTATCPLYVAVEKAVASVAIVVVVMITISVIAVNIVVAAVITVMVEALTVRDVGLAAAAAQPPERRLAMAEST